MWPAKFNIYKRIFEYVLLPSAQRLYADSFSFNKAVAALKVSFNNSIIVFN